MFPIKCVVCKQELNKPGALFFSPPEESYRDSGIDETYKQHICVDCYDWIVDKINLGYAKERQTDVQQ